MFTLVLPAYNEAEGIADLLDRIHGAFTDCEMAYEVLVVDDGSTDGTAAIVEGMSDRLPIHLVRHPENRGYGRALCTGLREAAGRSDVVVTMDADDSHDPRLVPVMLDSLRDGHDLIVASRFQPGAMEVGVPAPRRLLSHVASWLLRSTCPLNGVRDYTSGYRAYRSTLLRALARAHGPAFVSEAGFAAGLEILLKARALGARVHEVPLVLRYDRKQSVSKMSVGRAIRENLAVVAHTLRDDYRRPASRKGRKEAPAS